jgi:uncharacterized spore protein YtfJ
MNIEELLVNATRPLEARMVFADPVEKDGVTVIPAARVAGGAGGGNGEETRGRRGEGGGLGLTARPAGVYVIKDGEVTWRPAVDANRVVTTVGMIAVAVVLVLGRALRAKGAA